MGRRTIASMIAGLSIGAVFALADAQTVHAQTGRATSAPTAPSVQAADFDLEGARLATIDGPITAVTLDYLTRSIQIAESEEVALVLALNTPGGDVSSMRAMTERMLAAEVPILVWVGPQGGQAASAGTFIVLAAHAAAMAPRTTMGAASPVGGGGDDLPETLRGKITEDLSALARTYAERRGEPAAEWAQAAVRDAVSATADEALELGLIDVIAVSPEAMVVAINGLPVDIGATRHVLRAPEGARVGRPQTGASEPVGSSPSAPDDSGAGTRASDGDGPSSAYPGTDDEALPSLSPIEPTSAERMLSFLAHPAVALLLLTLGLNAILIELSNPGGWVAGIVGVSALALGFYSLGALDANFVGLAFIAGAVALFVLELKTPTSGLFTVAGLGLFIAGSVVLFSGTAFGVPWPTVIGTAGFTAVFVLFIVGAALRALARRPVTGAESLIGHRAEVKRALQPRGTVLLAGELWDAVLSGEGAAGAGGSPTPVATSDLTSATSDPTSATSAPAPASAPAALGVPVGESVIVVGREGYVLIVKRA